MADTVEIQKCVENIFSNNDYTGFNEISVDANGMVTIDIEWGDWKHDHLYVRHIMTQAGFVLIDEVITEEDDSDCYSATHSYLPTF